MATSKVSERGIDPNDEEWPKILEQFKGLQAPSSIEEFHGRRYDGKFLKFFSESKVLKGFVSTTWQGTEFNNGKARVLVRTLFKYIAPKDEGDIKIAESVYDGLPCLRIDYSNRFYETRKLNDTDLMSIVTFRESNTWTSKWISDVNIMTPEEEKKEKR